MVTPQLARMVIWAPRHSSPSPIPNLYLILTSAPQRGLPLPLGTGLCDAFLQGHMEPGKPASCPKAKHFPTVVKGGKKVFPERSVTHYAKLWAWSQKTGVCMLTLR